MIKLRNAHYCNVKLLLIFFVMYGHLIEPWIDKSNVLHEQYRWIYFFHMPLFCFLSGLFVQTEKDCCIAIRKTLPLYVVLQMLAVLVGQGQVKLLTPYWHFWYLLSYCCWQGLAWLLLKFMSDRSKILILMVVFIAGCFVGYLPFVGRRFSLSRTFVFLPYFFAGVLMKPSFPWKKYRVLGWGALGLATLIVLRVCENIPITFLYQATAFGEVKNGAFYRLICYLIGGLLSFGILTVMPSKRLPFTKAGADTMPVYLLHVLLVLYLRKWAFSWQIYFIITGAFLYVLNLLMRWHGKLYGIVPEERRESKCQSFKKYTNNMRSRYIASCCPSQEAKIWQRNF